MGREPPEFDAAFRARLRELFCWRRDVRRFRPDALPAGMLERLIEIACTAPSVGLSQPWRFVVVEDSARRDAVRANFEAANAEAEEFGRDRLGALMRETAALSPSEAVDRIVDVVQRWAKTQGDDLTLLLCDYAGAAG